MTERKANLQDVIEGLFSAQLLSYLSQSDALELLGAGCSVDELAEKS